MGKKIEKLTKKQKALFPQYVEEWIKIGLCTDPADRRHNIVNKDNRGRIHSLSEPAIAYPDGWSIYAVHGVRVPEFVVMQPDEITVPIIEKEKNAEIRRVMIQRYKGGAQSYLADSGATQIHKSTGWQTHDGRKWNKERILWKKERPDDTPIVMVQVINSTPEPDGEIKNYWLRVPPNMTDADAAIAWTFGKDKTTYQPIIES